MCCACEESTLGLRSTYWFPHQWERAVKRAIHEGKETGVKHKVYMATFSGGNMAGWKVKPNEN